MQKLTNHTCRHLFNALMFTGAIFCICPTSALLGQQARTPIYSEATIDLVNGIRKSRLINVKFKQNILPLVAGARKGTTAQINSAFPNVISFFATLEQRHGPAVFYKKIPQATWGDVWRRNKITGQFVQIHDLSQLFAVQFPQAAPTDSMVAELEKLAEVEYAYPPVQAISFVQPNDPCYNNFLNCDGTAPVSDQWNLKRIDAEQAWDITQGSSSIVVAIIDPNLFNRNHPDLDSKFTLNGDLDSTPNAPQHGTQVAGVVAAETNNGQGIASLGWNLKMGTYNFQSTIYEDEQGPNSLEYEIVRATNDNVDIINCSFGTTTTVGNCVVSQSYLGVRDAIANAILQGIIVAAATGNGDENAGKPECSSYFPFTPFPAFYDFVIGVTATDLNDNHPAGYNYEGPIVIDPFIDVAAPGWQIPTTGGSGYGAPNGTSFAAPHVAALVGLMKSINSSLDKVAITDILTNTAEKVGQYAYVNGRNEHLGSGRINAYQALLMTHAYSNKSASATATATNNGRRLVKTSDGKYHLVFESGITSGGNVLSEIFYRNYNGTSWSTPIRLSAGSEQNRYPSITASGNTLYVVWQRKNDSTHDVYFATSQNSGTTWSNYVLAATSLAADPLPVIQVGVTANFSLMAIYRTNSGGSTRLVARRTTSVNPILSNWSAETTVPSTGANDFSPSPASTPNYWGQDANFGVAYATTAGQIQYRYYQHATGGWSSTPFNLSAIVPAANVVHQTPSLTGIAGSTSLHVAWYMEYTNNSGAYRHSIIHRKSNGFDNWPNVYTELFGDRFRPSITSVSSSTADLIFQYAVNDNGIAKMRYNGSSWGSVTTVSSVGKYPSVSTGSSNAKFVWTSGSSSPYTVNLSSETLSKSVSDQPSYSRSIAWLDSSGAYLEIQVHQIGVKLKNGTEQNLDFVSDSLALAQLTPANAWSFLAAVPSLLPVDAESLFVDYTVAANNLQSVANAGGNRYVSVNVKNINGHTVFSKTGLSLPSSGAIVKITQRLTIAVNTPGVVPLQVDVDVKGLTAKSTAFPSLGHIYDFTKLGQQSLPRTDYFENGFTPKTTVLFDNYPDPFNPETTINTKFSKPLASR